MENNPLPHFLVIGAQKSGTTTLSHDLDQHPSIYVPPSKEVDALVSDSIYSKKGLKTYQTFYKPAQPGQLCGDASTRYSMMPYNKGVPDRARNILGEQTKILYIVRDPVDRIFSHYKHWYSRQNKRTRTSLGLQKAIQRFPHFLDYSCYAKQLLAWLHVFPPENIRVVHFETYVQRRTEALSEIYKFLGVSSDFGEIQVHVFNRAEDRRKAPPILRNLIASDLYKAYVKTHMPVSARKAIKKTFTKPAPLPEENFGDEWRAWASRELERDQRQLAHLLGHETMNWNADSWTGGAVCAPLSGKYQDLHVAWTP